jgi:hypothetical protein
MSPEVASPEVVNRNESELISRAFSRISCGSSVACPWSVILSWYSGFFHHYNWSP